MNSELYIQVPERLLKQILKVSSQFWKKGRWFHLHDNATAHSKATVKHFLAHYNVVQTSHPLYLPYLIPVDIFVFPKWKSTKKGIFQYQWHQEECNCPITCSSLGCLQWLLCATVSKI